MIPPGDRLRRLAHAIVGADQAERFADPIIADMQHEWLSQMRTNDAVAARRTVLRAAYTLLLVLGWVECRELTRRFFEVPWWVAAPTMMGAALGVMTLPEPVASSQLLWVVLATAAMLGAATTPVRRFHQLRHLAMFIAIAAMIATSGWAEPYGGAMRWLSLGGISLRTALLALPIVLVALPQFGRTARTVFATAILALGALQPDPSFVVGLGIGWLVVDPDRSVWTWLCALGAMTGALAHESLLHFPGRIGAPGMSEEILAAGIVMATTQLALSLYAIWASRRNATTPPNHDARTILRAAVGISLSTLVMSATTWLVDGQWPGVSYGGSLVVSTFVATGLALRCIAVLNRPVARC